MFDAKKVKDQCVQWIREFFEENGPGCNAVIGISGGKDSSVAAALCVEALGKDRVIGVLMPKGEQQDIDMSRLLVEHLGIFLCGAGAGRYLYRKKASLFPAVRQSRPLRFFTFCGRHSLPIYMLHQPALALIAAICFAALS